MATKEGLLGLRERYIEAEETIYGTAVALTSALIPGYDIEVTPSNMSQGFQEIRNDGNDNRTLDSQYAGPLSLEYDLTYTPTNWRRLKYVFDIDSETGSGPYTHTLSVGNTLKSYTAEHALRHSSAPLILKTTGNVTTRFELNWRKATGPGREGFIRATESIVAQNYTTPSLQAGSFSVSDDPFRFQHVTWTLAGSEVVEVNNGAITFEQGITPSDSRYASTSLGRTIGSPIPSLFRIRGRVNVNLFDTTYADIWELAAAITGTNTLVFEQSASNKVTFTFTNVYVDPIPLGATNVDGVNSVDFVFTAMGVAVVAVDSVANW